MKGMTGVDFSYQESTPVRVPNREPQSADRKFRDLDGRPPMEAAGA